MIRLAFIFSNLIDHVHSFNFLGEEVEGIILTLYPHDQQTDPNYEYKEVCTDQIFLKTFLRKFCIQVDVQIIKLYFN